MKEIGKLLELLNEYQYGMFVYENDLLLLRIGSSVKVGGESFVISKKFGFIKRLVENDKIEYKNLNKIHTRKGLNVLIEQNLYEDLIMLLAISDTPIEDLILYLK